MKGIWLAVGSTLILLLSSWGWLQRNNADVRATEPAMAAFADFVRAENGLQRLVLSARSGSLRNYDPIVREIAVMQDALEQLRRSGISDETFAVQADALAELTLAEEALAERFKSTNALLHNSLAYFGRLSGQLGGADPPATREVNGLATAVLRLVVDPSPTRLAQLDEEIARIELMRGDNHPGLSALIAHARQLRLLLPEMDTILDALATLGNGSSVEAVGAALLARQATVMARGDIVRIFLYAIALVLVCLLAWAGVQLRARIDALRRRAAIEHVVAKISLRFLNTPSWQMKVHLALALEELAVCFGATRAYFVVPGAPEHTVTYARGGPPFQASWPEDVVEHLASAGLQDGGIVHVEDSRTSARPSPARFPLAGVVSWLCIARVGDDTVQAVLGFDSGRPRAFRNSDANQLLALAFDALTNAVSKTALEEERERLEAHLQHAKRMETVGVFASGIAHNFNNIIGAIVGHAEMAATNATAGSNLTRHMEAIQVAGERARQLVDQVLGLGRRGESTPRPIRIDGLIAEAVSLLQTSLPPSVRLLVGETADTLVVQAEAAQLLQVVLNLCRNAADAVDGAGRITLTTRTEHLAEPRRVGPDLLAAGRYAVLAVEDDGRGIDEVTLARIFEPFFTTRREGNGLGLATAAEIVRGHRGAITVTTTPGVGSRFEVWLPAAPANVAPVEGRGAGATVERGAGETVMLVERNAPRRMRLEEVLAALGYEPVGFSDWALAVAAARATPDRFDAAVVCSSRAAFSGACSPGALHDAATQMPIILSIEASHQPRAERLTRAGIAEVIPYPPTSAQLAGALATRLRTPRNQERFAGADDR